MGVVEIPKGETGTIVCRVSIPLPEHCPCFEVSEEHPDLHLEIEGCLPVSSGHMVEKIRTHEWPSDLDLTEAFQRRPKVKEVNKVATTPDSAVHEVTVPVCAVISLHEKLRIMPTFSFHIKNGRESFVVASTSDKVRGFIAQLKAEIPGTMVEAINRGAVEDKVGLLTERQREIFHVAIRTGYWDVPRRTSLSEMAEHLAISKSTLSEHISMIERKLLHQIEEQHLARI